jgi:hypothetical protein
MQAGNHQRTDKDFTMRSLITAAAAAIAVAACSGEQATITTNGKISDGDRTLSGTVFGSSASDTSVAAAALAGASVVAGVIPDGPDSSIIDRTLAQTTTDANGHFRFTNVPSGRILIVASPRAGTPYVNSVREISAGTTSVTGINIVLPDTTGHGVPGGGNYPPPDSSSVPPGASRTINGTVLGVGTMVGADSGKVIGPVAGVTVTAKINQGGVLTTVGTAATDAAGHFSLANMPGVVVVLTLTPPAGTHYRNIDYFANPTGGTPTTITAYLYPVAGD